MAKLDFKHFSKYTGIRRTDKETGDAREEFADLIYRLSLIHISASPLWTG